MMKPSLSFHQKIVSLLYIISGNLLTLVLIVYFNLQLQVPFHDYGHQPIIIASILLYFLLPYLLMKLAFRISSFRNLEEEELRLQDIWEDCQHDLEAMHKKKP